MSNIRPNSNIHLNEQQLLTANNLTKCLLHSSTKTGKASCHSPVKLSQCPAADGVSVRGSSRGLHRPASRSNPASTTRSPGNRLPIRHSRLHSSGSWQVKFAATGRGKESTPLVLPASPSVGLTPPPDKNRITRLLGSSGQLVQSPLPVKNQLSHWI